MARTDRKHRAAIVAAASSTLGATFAPGERWHAVSVDCTDPGMRASAAAESPGPRPVPPLSLETHQMKTIIGLFETRPEAEDAITRLQAAGFPRERIGVAMRDTRQSADMADATGTGDLAAEGATTGAVSGAGVGVLIGLALAGSSVILPGVGPLLIGGPLAAALTGAGIGAASGGLLGGLVGAGIPEEEAQTYTTRLEQGHILVSVQCDELEADRARQILVTEGARTA